MNLSSLPSRVQALRDGFARCAIDVRSLAGTSRYTRFVIVGIARTGSTMLINLLNAHARALAFGELFRKPEAIGWDVHPYTDYRSERLLTLYQSDPCRFLEKAVFRKWPRGQQAVGFKIFYYHAREAPYSAVWDYLARHSNIRVLHIKRRNILAQYLSLQLAHKTNVWSTIHPVARETQPVRLEIEDCRKHFAWVRSLEEEADAFFAGHEMLQVVYEDLLADQTAEMSKVQEFLGLREQRLSARTVRQRTVPLPRAIANYGALKEAFSGTDWEDFFAETAH